MQFRSSGQSFQLDQGVLGVGDHNPDQDDGLESSGDDSSFEALVARARSGEPAAVGQLIDNYRNYLLLIANDYADSKLQAKVGASDAVQESIMHAQLNFGQFQGDSEAELKAWLTTIVTNDVRKNRRKFLTQKRSARREVNIQEQSAVGRGLLDGQLTPSSEAVQKEKARAMAAAIDRLSEDQQMVIQLRNYEHLGFAEIGQRMDRSADAARKLWARAIEALKLNLKTVAPELVDEQNENESTDG